MDKKIIKINKNNYLVATGDVKQIKGNITKDEILRIYKLRDLISTVNEEINNNKEKLKGNKISLEQMPKLRKTAIIACTIAALVIGIATKNIWLFSTSVIIYTGLYCIIEKFIKTVYGTKEQIKININNINMSIEKDYQKLKEYEKELTEIIERTNYQETDVEREKTWDDLLYTEEEIRLYMKEAPAPFDPKTIFTTSEEVEEQTDNLQKELNESRLVKRLTPSKNNGNK